MKRFLPLLVFLPSLVWGGLSKVYPTSAIAVVRLSAYQDGLATVYNSTDTIVLDTWDVLWSSYTWISSSQAVNGFYSVLNGTTPTVVPFTLTLKQYTDLVYQEGRLRAMNEIADDGIEVMMVYPSTETCPSGWKGWRLGEVNGKLIPVSCD